MSEPLISPAPSSFPNLTSEEMIELMLIEYREGRFEYPRVSDEERRQVVTEVLRKYGYIKDGIGPENAKKHVKNLKMEEENQPVPGDSPPLVRRSSFVVSDLDSDSLPCIDKLFGSRVEIRPDDEEAGNYRSAIITSPRSANGYGVKISKVSETDPAEEERNITITDVCSISDPLKSSAVANAPFVRLEQYSKLDEVAGNELAYEGELTPVSGSSAPEMDESASSSSPLPAPENSSQQYLSDTSTVSMRNCPVRAAGRKRSNAHVSKHKPRPQKMPHLVPRAETMPKKESKGSDRKSKIKKLIQTMRDAKKTYDATCAKAAKQIAELLAEPEQPDVAADNHLLPFLVPNLGRDSAQMLLMLVNDKADAEQRPHHPATKKKSKTLKKIRTSQ